MTNESGGTATFIVTLNTQPTGGSTVRIGISSTNPAEGTSNVTALLFTASGNPVYTVSGGVGTADWNINHVVTITGADDPVLDFSQTFFVITDPSQVTSGTDTDYVGINIADVQVTNLDDEVIPTLNPVWGGGSGGCGLLGAEAILLLGLAAVRRRRGRSR